MDSLLLAKKIEDTLQQQIDVIKKVYEYQKALSQCVLNRSWDGIEQAVLKVTEYSQCFLQLDKQCFLFLDQLAASMDDVTDFYGYIRILPDDVQHNLCYLYRILQHHVCMSKIENDSMTSYIEHARTLVDGMVQAAAEGTKTAFYTKTGAPAQSYCKSLVIDTVF